jgi:hypothetical protein
MENYILDRLRIDATHTLALAENEGKVPHNGLKGRFRELLIDNLLIPWLPPYISCGTGMIIAANNVARASNQDDVIIYDKSLTPSVLSSSNRAPDGVFLYNSVIARIEVKSSLRRDDIAAFVRSSCDIAALKFSTQAGFLGKVDGAYNLLFAYDSDAKGEKDKNFQLNRLLEVMREQKCDPLSGIISMLCIPGHGFWKLGESKGRRVWQRLILNTPADNLAWLTGCVSQSCYQAHAKRQGRDPSLGLEAGIGMFLDAPFEDVA